MLLAALAGLIAAIGIAFLLDYLDQTVKSDEDLSQRTGLATIGHIALAPAPKSSGDELPALKTESPVGEAYRTLRTNLLFSSVEKEIKTIVVTSAAPNEGKSRTAANLAIVLAEAGHRTVLLDADFRRPSQHRIFGRVRNLGLSNLILQEQGSDDLVAPLQNVANLWLITSGPSPPNPSELLGSKRMRELLAKLRENFAYVVIDTPPVNAVTDPSVVASDADATILVIDQTKTSYPAITHAKKALDRVGAHMIGAVMNKMRTSGGGYYAYDYGYTTSKNGQTKSAAIEQPAPSSNKALTRDEA
jgi:capsular exopolysaccharide synthesis family protein